MKIFGSLTIIAATVLMISCGNASEPQNNDMQANAKNTQYQDATGNDQAEVSAAEMNKSGENKSSKGVKSDKVNDKPVHLTKAEFLSKVMNYEVNKDVWKFEGDLPCIIDFYADWCRPCKMIAPIMDELAKEYKGKINIYKVNTEKEKELAAAFGIRSIPTLLFCPMNGNPQMIKGAQSKEQFEKLINDVLLKENK
jgi:thioredoxin